MIRRILGVVAGYVLFVVATLLFFRLSGHAPHAPQSVGFMALAVVVGIVAAFFSGNVASRIAGRPDLFAARGVALLIAVGAIVSLVSSSGSGWSQWCALLLMAPSAVAGGILHARRVAP